MRSVIGVKIVRDVKVPFFSFLNYFKGFEKVEAVRQIFGENTEKVIRELKVEFFTSRRGYMGVSEDDGHLRISAPYLMSGSERDIYLDIIHELVHVAQFMRGEELFDDRFEYVDRPTELEAFTHTVKEARKIGMSDKEIYEYLNTEWMSERDLRRLAEALGVKTPVASEG